MMSLLFYLGSWKVAVLRLHAASAGYVTKAPHSCLLGGCMNSMAQLVHITKAAPNFGEHLFFHALR
jgi:hypothetical protein